MSVSAGWHLKPEPLCVSEVRFLREPENTTFSFFCVSEDSNYFDKKSQQSVSFSCFASEHRVAVVSELSFDT